MTQCESILSFLRDHGGEATLGEMLQAGYGSWAHKLTARISDCRKKGHNIVCKEQPIPSHNIYRLIEEEKPSYRFENLQGVFL